MNELYTETTETNKMTGLRRILPNRINNMRDLGGYPTKNGKMTEYGKFLRSDAPVGFADYDIEYLKNYGDGLTTVIDFRLDEEIEKRPSPFVDIKGIAYHNIKLIRDFAFLDDISLFDPVEHYVPMLQIENKIAEVITLLAEAEGMVLFHCTAGKDRTGLTAAILLMLAEVYEEDIIADYEITYTYMKKIIMQMAPDGKPIDMLKSKPEAMEIVIDFIKESGGIRRFLESKGVGQGVMERILEKFLG